MSIAFWSESLARLLLRGGIGAFLHTLSRICGVSAGLLYVCIRSLVYSRTKLLSRRGVGEFNLTGSRLWVTWVSVRYVCADCESRTRLPSQGDIGEFNLAGSRLCVTWVSVLYVYTTYRVVCTRGVAAYFVAGAFVSC